MPIIPKVKENKNDSPTTFDIFIKKTAKLEIDKHSLSYLLQYSFD